MGYSPSSRLIRPRSVWSAKLLFSFDLSVKVKAKQEFSTPNASATEYFSYFQRVATLMAYTVIIPSCALRVKSSICLQKEAMPCGSLRLPRYLPALNTRHTAPNARAVGLATPFILANRWPVTAVVKSNDKMAEVVIKVRF